MAYPNDRRSLLAGAAMGGVALATGEAEAQPATRQQRWRSTSCGPIGW
ncbi:twin-arginine translocation signal domain-containing protein [Sphingomonas aerolata]